MDFMVRYLTIDQLRNEPDNGSMNWPVRQLLVMIAGVTVPGKYLGGTPATLTEIQQVGHMVRGPKKLIGGPDRVRVCTVKADRRRYGR